MKKLILPLIALFFLTQHATAQLEAHAGNDTTVCAGASVILGGNPTATGGTGPYTYNWSPSIGLSSSTLANPVANVNIVTTYVILVTDNLGATATDTVIVNASPLVATIVNANSVTCFSANDGVLQVAASGGTPPYAYSWGGIPPFSNIPTLTNLAPGAYTIMVIDVYGCSATATGIITQPPPITVNLSVVNTSATNVCDGAINVTVTGGNAPYNYTWNGGITVQNIQSLCVGNYNLTVTDMTGCSASATTFVANSCTNNTLVVSITSQNLSCAHPQDTLTLNATGGTPPYYYHWFTNPQGVSPDFTVTQGGFYSGVVTDSVGCQRYVTDTVLNTGIQVTVDSATPASCNGNPNGSLHVSVTGGTPPYTYTWSNNSTAASLTNAAPGVYVLTVSDVAACSVVSDFTIGQNTTNYSYYVYVSTTASNCGNNGSATAQVVGGTGPFTYLWNYQNDTTATITGLAPSSNYTVTVTGADGCTRSGIGSIYTSCNNVITGNVFADTNNNCVQDSGELLYPYGVYVQATGTGGVYYGYLNNDGTYSVLVGASGSYTVNLSPNYWGGNCSSTKICGAHTVTFGGLGDTATADFGIGSALGFNLSIHPGWTSANPGFEKDYWVLYQQLSVPLYTGPAVITFTYDTILQYISCTNGGIQNPTNHTITWNLATVPQNWVAWDQRPMAYFIVPANTPVNYQLTQDFVITPIAGDCEPYDNHLNCTQPITGSQDPNEKEVSPAGDITEEDSVLTYTIHFQNTGNDTTWFITVKDTLSPYLNPVSVVNLASSHEYASFNVSENGILTWLFNPIFLVDSFTNEPASKGFVMFKVKKKPNLPLTTQIKNRAHIYFDYNQPVVTNTVTSTLTDPLSVHNVINDAAIQVAVAPNPFTLQTQITVEGITGAYNFELFDVSGQLLQKKNGLTNNRFTLNRDNMSAGIYFYSITTAAKQKAFGRLVVQ